MIGPKRSRHPGRSGRVTPPVHRGGAAQQERNAARSPWRPMPGRGGAVTAGQAKRWRSPSRTSSSSSGAGSTAVAGPGETAAADEVGDEDPDGGGGQREMVCRIRECQRTALAHLHESAVIGAQARQRGLGREPACPGPGRRRGTEAALGEHMRPHRGAAAPVGAELSGPVRARVVVHALTPFRPASQRLSVPFTARCPRRRRDGPPVPAFLEGHVHGAAWACRSGCPVRTAAAEGGRRPRPSRARFGPGRPGLPVGRPSALAGEEAHLWRPKHPRRLR
jgi:hypothetical protein